MAVLLNILGINLKILGEKVLSIRVIALGKCFVKVACKVNRL